MLKLIKILNWAYIALGTVAIVGLYSMSPVNVNFANFLIIVPCAVALIGLRSDSRKVASWFALVTNGLYFLLGLGAAVTTAIGKPGILLGVLLAALMAPYGLNAWWFGRALFSKPANPSLEPTP